MSVGSQGAGTIAGQAIGGGIPGAALSLGVSSLLGGKSGGQSWSPKYQIGDGGQYQADYGYGFKDMHNAPPKVNINQMYIPGLLSGVQKPTGPMDFNRNPQIASNAFQPGQWHMNNAMNRVFSQFQRNNPNGRFV